MSLTTYVFGPEGPEAPHVLAIHGLTGHGKRWESLAAGHLADLRVIAPDLLGHGHSTWVPPWSFEAHVASLVDVVDRYVAVAARPFVIVGHSFGGAIAVRLARQLGTDSVRGLVLLDPAQGLDPAMALEVATDSLEHWDYTDAVAAKAAKRAEGWSDVPEDLLDKEIDDHLIDNADRRVGWRVSAPAAATAWSEMARDAALPPAGVPTTIVVADRVDPPFVRPAFLEACTSQRPDTVEIVHADCEHMVPFLAPELTARTIRSMFDRA
ncbi:alpha/beta fold hydrolase [Gordonia sp. SID5947]|uniref:alpha/beta fold hydrolase n=1 Tax=Gordonia sp. SID5947 TaxID=2690315 RepID=UPI00136A1874|nr:alpha/beta fold hydrolase [Gordonia sp. SID5947]MYR08942.1 alpha/beta fold hydrolase [Gordonia sp. SID5947]